MNYGFDKAKKIPPEWRDFFKMDYNILNTSLLKSAQPQ